MRRGDRPRFPVSEIFHYSNGASACAIRCTGRTPRDRDRAACRIAEAKDALRDGAGSSVGGPSTPAVGLSLPVHINRGRTCGAPCPASGIQATLAGRIGGLHKARAGVVRVTCIITWLSPWSRTGTIRSGWRSRAGFVIRRSHSAARIVRSDDAGDGKSSRRCLTAAGASRFRFPLTGRSRRDSIRGTGRQWPDKQPAQVREHLHGPNPQHGVTHVSG